MAGNRQTTVLDAEINAVFGKIGTSRLTADVAKAVAEGSKAFSLDPKAFKPFQDSAHRIATQFSTIIGKTQAVGLTKDAERVEALMNKMREGMVQDTTKAAEVMAQLAKAKNEDEKEGLRAQLKALKTNIDQRQKMLDAEVKGLTTVIERRQDAMKDYLSWAKKTQGEKFTAGASVAEGFIEQLGKVDARDMGGMVKGLMGGVARAAKGAEGALAAKAAGAGSAAGASSMASMAAMAGTLAASAAALAAVAGVLVAIGGLFKMAYDRSLEMNKSILEGAGAADLMDQSGVGLTSTLDAARETAIALSYEFRRPAKELVKITAEANQAGFTFKEMEERLKGTGDAAEAYGKYMRTTLVYSNLLGASTKEITDVSAEWIHDFGMGLQDVQSSFSAISQVASVSGMGTKRFFGFVTQATTGMALYNVRVEEAAALIGELSESLGDTNAAEFVKALMKGFTADAYTERFKKVLLAGQGTVTRILEANAEVLSGEFAKAVEGSGKSGEVQKAFESFTEQLDLGAEGGKGFLDQLAAGDAAALQKLQGMTAKDQRSLLRQVTAADKAAGRQLSKLIDGTDFMSGSLTDTAKSLDELGPGGKLAMQLESASAVIGAPISEMTGIQLAAFEQMTGISGEQLFELRKVDAQLRGNYEFAQEQLAKQDITHDDNLELIKQTGMMVVKTADGNVLVQAALDEQGNIIAEGLDEQGNIIEGATLDTIDSQEEAMVKFGGAIAKAVEKPMTEAEKMSAEIVSNTESIFNVLDSVMASGFERLADILQALYDVTAGTTSSERAQRDQLLKEVTAEREMYATGLSAGEKQLRAIEEAEANGEITAEQAKEQRAEWETYTADMQAGLDETSASMKALVTAGEGFGTTSMETMRAEAGMGTQTSIRRAGGAQYSMEEYRAMTPEQKRAMEEEEAAYAERKAQGGVSVTLQRPAGGVLPGQEGYGVLAPNMPDTEGPTDFVTLPEDEVVAEQAEALGETILDPMDQMTSEQVSATEDAADKMIKAEPKAVETAILTAGQKTQAMEAAKILGGSDEDAVTKFFDDFMRGKRADATQTATLQQADPKLAALLGNAPLGNAPTVTAAGGDFLYRAGANTITPFSSADDIMGAKPGGAVDNALGGGGGGNVIVNVNGGDTAQIYAVVRRAIASTRGTGPTG